MQPYRLRRPSQWPSQRIIVNTGPSLRVAHSSSSVACPDSSRIQHGIALSTCPLLTTRQQCQPCPGRLASCKCHNCALLSFSFLLSLPDHPAFILKDDCQTVFTTCPHTFKTIEVRFWQPVPILLLTIAKRFWAPRHPKKFCLHP